MHLKAETYTDHNYTGNKDTTIFASHNRNKTVWKRPPSEYLKSLKRVVKNIPPTTHVCALLKENSHTANDGRKNYTRVFAEYI